MNSSFSSLPSVKSNSRSGSVSGPSLPSLPSVKSESVSVKFQPSVNSGSRSSGKSHTLAQCRAKKAALLSAIAALPEPFTLHQIMAALPPAIRAATSFEYIRFGVQHLIHEFNAIQSVSKGYSRHPGEYRRLPTFVAHHAHFLSQPLRTPRSALRAPLDPPTPHEVAWRHFRSTELQLPDDNFYSRETFITS